LCAFLLLGVTFTAGALADRVGLFPGSYVHEPISALRPFSPFWEAWNKVHEKYVDREAVNDERMTQGAIIGMLASLGDVGHTTYLSREEWQRLEEGLKGELEGIGARITVRKRRPTILQTMPHSPAREAGLKAGDVLLDVDGKDVSTMSLEQLVGLVRGPAGTVVHLKVLREGQSKPLDLAVIRAKVDVPDVVWQMLPDGTIAHVAIQSFGERTDEQLRTALAEAEKQGARGLLVDVRGNPGGLKNQAVAVTSEFLEPGQVVFIEQDAEGHQKKIDVRDKPAGVARAIPVVVLIDEGTASSSEIFAGALQDYGRAKLVGTRTFGTGTVLEAFKLTDGSAILLAVDQWLTPKGRKIWHEGISPDVEVTLPQGATILLPDSDTKLTAEDLDRTEDKQLRKAYDLLKQQLHQAP
jgi:carboxyl-terminal processing protease